MRTLAAALASVILALAGPALAAEPLIRDGDFVDWRDGAPAAWSVTVVAAIAAPRVESVLAPGPEGGVLLSGDAATTAWRRLGQAFPASPGETFRLAFQAREPDPDAPRPPLERCHVALAFYDAAGRRLALHARRPDDPRLGRQWHEESAAFRAPPGTARGEVQVLLGAPGRLEVRAVSLHPWRPDASFELLARDMDRHYALFALRKVDWSALVERHRAAAEAAKTPAAFASAVEPLLAALEDPHIAIDLPGGGRLTPHWVRPRSGLDNEHVASRLRDARRFGRDVLVGRTAEGYGYIAIDSLLFGEERGAAIEDAIAFLLDAPGIIIDARCTGHGEERVARRLLSFFCDARRPYAVARLRAGPAHDRFGPPIPRFAGPRSGPPYVRPIVGLIGPGCIGGGEAIPKILRTLPHATLVGKPTRGASGHPVPLHLPNGCRVSYSRRLDMLPDGTVTEGVGVLPHVEVDPAGAGDPTFEAGVRELAARIAARRE